MTHAAPAPAESAPHAPVSLAELSGARLSFAHLVRGEWIKMRSLRSTWWCWGLIVLVTVGIAALAGANLRSYGEQGDTVATHGTSAQQYVVLVGTIGVVFAQLIAAVLAVLNIAGEYSTGMIRATFAAAPRRTGAVFAKGTVLAVTTFVVSAVSIWAAVLVASPLLAHNQVDIDLGTWKVWMPLLGASVYITLTALLAFAFGLLLRSAAGGIATSLGLLLIAPIIALIVYGFTNNAVWMYDIIAVLPGNAGGHLYSFFGSSSPGGMSFDPGAPHEMVTDASGNTTEGAVKAGSLVLNGWGGFGVLAAWNVIVGGIALYLVKRRDA